MRQSMRTRRYSACCVAERVSGQGMRSSGAYGSHAVTERRARGDMPGREGQWRQWNGRLGPSSTRQGRAVARLSRRVLGGRECHARPLEGSRLLGAI